MSAPQDGNRYVDADTQSALSGGLESKRAARERLAYLAGDANGSALVAPYTGRAGVLDRPNSPRAVAWIRDHWGLPASMAQAVARLERANARLVADAIAAAREGK